MAKNKRLSATGGKSRKPQPRSSPKNKKRASTARVPDTAAAAVAPAVALAHEAATDQVTSVADQDESVIDDDALPTVEVVEDADGKDKSERHVEQELHDEVPAVAPAADDEPVPHVVEPVPQVVEPAVEVVEEPAVEEPVVEEPVVEPTPAAPTASAHLEPEPAPERRRTASTASRTPDATFGGATGAPSMIRIYLPSSVASNKLQSSMEFMLAPSSTDGKTPSFTLRRVPKVTVTPKMPFVLVEQHHAEKLLTMRKELLIKDHAEPNAAASAAASAATAASAAPRARTVSAHSRVSGAEERSESVWMLEFASDSEDNGHVHYVDEQGVEHDACLVGDDKIQELPSEAAPAPETAALENEPTSADVAPVTEPVESPLDAAPQEPAPQERVLQETTPVVDATPSPSDSAAPSVTDPPAAAAPAPTATESTPAATPALAEPTKPEPVAEPVSRALSPDDADDDPATDSAVVTESAATSASLPRAAAALPHKDSKDNLMVRLKRSFLSLRRKSSSASLASSSTLARRASDSSSSADEDDDEKKVSDSRGSATLARGTATTLPRASGDKEGKPSLLKKLRHRVSKFGSDSDDEEHEAKKAAKKAAKAEKKAQKLLKKQEKEAAKNAAGARKSRFGSST
ncbi:hypothetical protein GGF32_000205 [Allomyces javanicus]|nr:hypothetical protein GGF32_000205 [Allomyces javanicus]